MIKLRVIGFSDDHEQLLLSNKPRGRRGSHVVAIDKKLLSVLQDAVYGKQEAEKEARGERTRTVIVPPRDEPRFPPREIQRMLRAGMSPTQVAKSAGVDVGYVEQFYGPVLSEREGVVREFGSLFQDKPRKGMSGLPLGEAVEKNLAARRVRLDEDAVRKAWLAVRTEGQPWTLSLTFSFRGRSNRAVWRFDPRTRVVTPVNKLASDIGWVPNGAERVDAAQARAREAGKDEVRQAAERRRARGGKPAAKRKPAKRSSGSARRSTSTPKRAAAARSGSRAQRKPAKRSSGAKRTTARTAVRKPSTRRATVRKPAARKPAARKASVRKPAAHKAPTRKAPPRRSPARKTAARATRRKPARRR